MIDLKAIRDVALVTSDAERMQFKPSTVISLLDRLEAANQLICAIETDRHDVEDWPTDSRKAFKAMKEQK